MARLQHDGLDWPLRQALTLEHGEDLSLSPVEDERHRLARELMANAHALLRPKLEVASHTLIEILVGQRQETRPRASAKRLPPHPIFFNKTLIEIHERKDTPHGHPPSVDFAEGGDVSYVAYESYKSYKSYKFYKTVNVIL